MLKIVLTRVAIAAPTLVIASLLIFSVSYLVPGDPAVLLAGENASEERIAQIRERLGLDQPFLERFGDWFSHALQGDLGSSLFTGQPVLDSVVRVFPITLQITVFSLVVAVLFGSLFGLLASLPRSGRLRSVANLFSSVAIAIPNFWLGMILCSFFALQLGWVPATGAVLVTDDLVQGIRTTLMPAIALGLAGGAEIAKQLSASTRSVLSEDFVRTGRSKGVSRPTLVVRDVLPLAAIAPITTFGVLASRTLGATVAVEAVFGIPGLGSLIVKAASERDLPVLQGVVLLLAVLVVVVNLAVDLSYRALDPRIRS